MATPSEIQRMQLRFEAAVAELVRTETIAYRTPEEIRALVRSCMLDAVVQLSRTSLWDSEDTA